MDEEVPLELEAAIIRQAPWEQLPTHLRKHVGNSKCARAGLRDSSALAGTSLSRLLRVTASDGSFGGDLRS